MLQMIPKPGLTGRQKGMAVAFAGVVDLLQITVFPVFGWGALSPVQDAMDLLTALVLVAICGFRWQFAVGFAAELVPGLTLFPTWTAVALTLPTRGVEGATEGLGRSPQGAAAGRVRATGRVVDGVRPAGEVIDVEAVAVPPVQAPPMGPKG